MTTYSAIVPTTAGADAGPAVTPSGTSAGADKISHSGTDLLLVIENTVASPATFTLEDARSQQQAGAPASTTFADLVVTVPASDRIAVRVTDTTRFKSTSTGNIDVTVSVTTFTWQAYDITG